MADNPYQGGYPAVAVYQPSNQLVATFPPAVAPCAGGPPWYASDENQVFAWNGRAWTQLAETWGDSGVLASEAAAAYDPISKRVIQFGGIDQGIFGDVLAYDGTAWRFVTYDTPNAAGGASLAFTDPSAGAIVMLSGREFRTDGPDVAGTWTWDGAQFKALPGLPEPPRDVTGEGDAQLVWDPAVAHAILVANDGSATLQMWEWMGTTSGWQKLPA